MSGTSRMPLAGVEVTRSFYTARPTAARGRKHRDRLRSSAAGCAPAERLATQYLEASGMAALAPEVRAIIVQHHKLTQYRGSFAPTVEPFRRADLVDVSLGLVRSSVARTRLRAVRAAFPNAGFHR